MASVETISEEVIYRYVVERWVDAIPPATIRSELLAHRLDPQIVERTLARVNELFRDEFSASLATGSIFMRRRASQSSVIVAAEKQFRRANELKPDDPHALSMLGWSLDNQGRWEEALKCYERALAIDPQEMIAKQRHALAVDVVRPTSKLQAKEAIRVLYTRFPETLEAVSDLEQAMANHIFNHITGNELAIHSHAKLVTLGSCFSEHLTHGFNAAGLSSTHISIGDQNNNTFANRIMFRDALQYTSGSSDRSGEPSEWDGAAAHFKNADFIFYALGVAACFFDKESGQFMPSNGTESIMNVAKGKQIFRNTTVEENVENILAIIDMMHETNPGCTFILLLAPTGGNATLERRSAIEADCLSKSILRVAVEQVQLLRPKRCFYWPVFEIVRWLGAYIPGMYGGDDGTAVHISEDKVKMIVNHFLKLFKKDG